MADKFKVCPFCKEEIREAAVKCRYCGEWLEGDGEKVGAAPPTLSAEPGVPPKATAPSGSAGDYWYGYLYVVFCGYLTYCAASHLLVGATKLAPTGDVAIQTEYWVGLVLWAGATAFFAYVTYKLARREASMGLIYTIVTLHGVSVLARGIRPGELVIWLLLSGIVVTKFRERNALDGGGATEDDRYELLNKATRLETKGRVEDALAAYREIVEKYPNSPAGQDARRSIESLEAKILR